MLADDREHDYLVRGIAADLATDLARLTGMTVIAALAVPPKMAEGMPANVATAELRYLVSGTLQRDGEQLRVNVHLSDAGSLRQIWSVRYLTPADDPLAVQKGIVARLLDVLPAKVSDAARESVSRRYTRNPDSYDYFLRGQGVVAARGGEENAQARTMYRKALELDPTFARAYAMLGVPTCASRWHVRTSSPRRHVRSTARRPRRGGRSVSSMRTVDGTTTRCGTSGGRSS